MKINSAIILSLSILFFKTSHAQDGTLFSSFGTGGSAITNFGSSHDYATSMQIQADGKVVLAGYGSMGGAPAFFISRFNTNGLIDNSFDFDGKVIVRPANNQSYAYSIQKQPDGKLIVGGYVSSGPSGFAENAICRLNTDGALDATFATIGRRLIDPSSAGHDYGRSVALQSDGKMLITGYSYTIAGWRLSLTRLNADGTLDNTFGTSGVSSLPWGNGISEDQPLALKILSSGKIMFATFKTNGAFKEFYLLRANADGTIDNTFDSDGIAQFSIGTGDDLAVNFTETTGGKIYVVGRSNNGTNNDFSIIRLNINGSLDNTFDTDGIKIIDINGGADMVYDVTEQLDGKILMTGGTTLSGNTNIAVVRLNTDGTFDNTFDTDGVATFDYQGGEDIGSAIQQLADGKIIVGGWCYTVGLFTNNNFAVLKLNSDGSIDNTYGISGYSNANIGTNDDRALAAGVQSTGKIISATYASQGNSYDMFLSRYNADGTFDNVFGIGGTFKYSIGSFINGVDKPAALKILSGDKILIAAQIQNTASTDVGLLMFNSDGTPDNSWATAGQSIIDFGTNSSDDITSMAIQADGKIVIGGHSTSTGNFNFIAVRFNADGSVDNGFGTSGKVSIDIGTASNDQCFSIAIQPDGKVLLAGTTNALGNNDFATVRLNSDGSMDNGFDADGKVITGVSANHDNPRAILLQTDGKIIVAGNGGNTNDFEIVRYNNDGSLDLSFNSTGKRIHDLGAFEQIFTAVLQNDGKFMLGGFANNGNSMVLARYNIDGSNDITFGTNGVLMHAGGASSDQINYLQLLPDNNLMAIGTSNNGLNNDVVLAKFNNSFTVLPLIWGDVTLQKQLNNVIVHWETLQEDNTDHFEVQRQLKDGSWLKLTTINARGNTSTTKQYSFLDRQPGEGNNYYRIKQIDKDGRFTYSIIRSIRFEINDKAIRLISSNLITDFVKINVKAPSGNHLNLSLLSATGQLLWTKKYNEGNYNIDLKQFPSGVYILKSEDQQIRLIKN